LRGKPIRWLMAVSAASCVIWAAGLGWTLWHYFVDKPETAAVSQPVMVQPDVPGSGTGSAPASAAVAAPENQNSGSFRILALGDSLARGTGDAEGLGFAGRLADLLEERSGRQVELVNQGVNGLTSEQLEASLKQGAVREEIKSADMLLVSIGGNDLFRGGETLGNLDGKLIGQIQADYNRRLQSILTQIRGLNPNARINLVGLYNPFIEWKDSAATSKFVRDWNYAAGETASSFPGVVLVPTFDLFQLQVRNYLSADQFHPNGDGYRLIAERMSAGIKL
jgi:lysophospholipase L1-like esterase